MNTTIILDRVDFEGGLHADMWTSICDQVGLTPVGSGEYPDQIEITVSAAKAALAGSTYIWDMNWAEFSKFVSELGALTNRNYHSEAVALLAEHSDNPYDADKARSIVREHNERGHLTASLLDRRTRVMDRVMQRIAAKCPDALPAIDKAL